MKEKLIMDFFVYMEVFIFAILPTLYFIIMVYGLVASIPLYTLLLWLWFGHMEIPLEYILLAR